jgi:hypothetical protein
MFCPQCRQEYRAGITTCTECGVALVEILPAAGHDEAEWVDLVTVLKTGDDSTIKVVKSLLEAEGIPCMLQGGGMQDLVGLGRAGAGFNVALGPVQVQVRPQDVDAALELLEAHDLGFTGPDELPEEREDV